MKLSQYLTALQLSLATVHHESTSMNALHESYRSTSLSSLSKSFGLSSHWSPCSRPASHRHSCGSTTGSDVPRLASVSQPWFCCTNFGFLQPADTYLSTGCSGSREANTDRRFTRASPPGGAPKIETTLYRPSQVSSFAASTSSASSSGFGSGPSFCSWYL